MLAPESNHVPMVVLSVAKIMYRTRKLRAKQKSPAKKREGSAEAVAELCVVM
jgi:hypothetical protein